MLHLTCMYVKRIKNIYFFVMSYLKSSCVLDLHECNDSTDQKLRRIATRSWSHHLVFFGILCCEVIIASVVYVGGVNFVLSQSTAKDIVGGVLSISFICDIDNQSKDYY